MTSLLHVKLSKQKDRLLVEARPDPRLGGIISPKGENKTPAASLPRYLQYSIIVLNNAIFLY
jgi:hypothetical protein